VVLVDVVDYCYGLLACGAAFRARHIPSDRIKAVMSKRLLVVILLGIIAIFLFLHAGSFLVVNHPEPSNVIVVMGGGNNDLRYWNGVRLMQEGYAHRLVLNVFAKGQTFGNQDVDLAREFVNRTTPGQSTVCPLAQSSTYDEARYLPPPPQGEELNSMPLWSSP
jgi:hypothetical protein